MQTNTKNIYSKERSANHYSFSFMLFLLLVLVLPAKSIATNYYVSPTGNDNNAGTKAAPFKTIQKAADIVIPGDVVHVAPGIYQGTIKTSRSGTVSARIRYVSDTKWGARLIPPSGTESGDGMWRNTAAYIDIEGFELDGSSNPFFRGGIGNGGGYVRIYNNHVHHIFAGTNPTAIKGGGGAGINSHGTNYEDTRPNEIFNNIVHDIGDVNHQYRPTWTALIHGIYIANPNAKVYNNITYNNEGYGIHAYHNPQNAIIINNTTFHNVAGGIVLRKANGVLIQNNIVFDNLGLVNRGKGIDLDTSKVTLLNNLVYNNGNNPNSNAHGSMNEDPQFVNYIATGGGDYYLKSTSPAIDKGLASGAPTFDINNVRRPKGAGYDIGAYEYTRKRRK